MAVQDEAQKMNQFAFGNMDLTHNPDSINMPDYQSGANLDFDYANPAVSPFQGNLELFHPETPVAQNKRIRLDNTNPSGTSYNAQLFDQNNIPVTAGVGAATFNAFITAFDADLALAGITFVKTNFASNATVTYEFTGNVIGLIPYADWSIHVSGDLTATTIQEAIDESIAKELQPAVGVANLSRIYNLYTVRYYNPFSWDITGNSSNQGGLMGLTTFQAHGIIGIEKIHITSPNSTINGDWIAEKVDSYTFKIHGLAYSAITPASGIVITKISTYMELWRYNEVTDTKYRMFGSTRIPVRLENPIDLNSEPIDSTTDLVKWVDGEDYPRYLELKLSWVQDGALVINGGTYDYDTLGEESLMILANAASIEYTTQYQSGGNLQGATWNYSAWGSVDGVNQIKITDWTGQHPVYKGNDNATTTIVGVDSLLLQPTGKIDVVTINGITSGVWKYIYLKGVQYFNGGLVGYSITRVTITDSQTSVVIQHTGNENDTQVQDIGTLQYVPPIFKTGKNINTTRNRNVISNLKLNIIPDLSAWALTFNHNVCKRRIDAIENNFDGNGGVTGIAQEFQKVLNYDLVGYMVNEVYRFGLIARDKATGNYFLAGFLVDDIVINAALTNTASVNDPTRRNNPNTCPITADTQPFLDNNLTDGTFPISDVFIPYVQFTGIDWNYPIGNQRVGDIIDQIQIVRAECIPEVLASGIGIPADVAIATGVLNLTGVEAPNTTTFAPFFAFPYISADPLNGVSAPAAALTNITPSVNRKVISNYWPDFYVTGNYPAVDTAADKVLINGKILVDDGFFAINRATNPSADNNSMNYISLFDPDLVDNDLALPFSIDEHAQVGTGQSLEVAGGDVFSNVVMRTPTNNKWGWVFESLFIRTTTGLPEIDPGVNANQIAYATQYYRALTNKYGNSESTNYIDTNYYCNNGIDSVDVFGGDTFTTSHYMRFRGSDLLSAHDSPFDGFTGGLNIYTQSRVNPQLRAVENTSSGSEQYYFPYNATFFQWLTQLTQENFAYNKGYSIFGQIPFQTYRGFDSTQPQQQDLITGEVWSLQSIVNALSRNLRVFPPLNIKIEDLQYGGITHHASDNGELVSWQPRMFKRQYFDTNNMLVDTEASTLVVGDGTVLKQRSTDVTQFGCCNKFAIVKGVSAGGDDIFLWPDAYSRAIVRYGRDGTVNISERAGISAWLNSQSLPYKIDDDNIYYNTSRHIYLSIFDFSQTEKGSFKIHDNSLIGNGITSVWDSKRKTAIWAARLENGINQYNPTERYRISTFVYFEGVLYISIIDNIQGIIPYDTTNWMQYTSLDINYNGVAIYYDPTGCFNGNYYYYKNVIYLCDVDSPANVLPTNTDYFTPVSNYITDPTNNITFNWSEKKHSFSNFITPTPKLYIQGAYDYYSFSPRVNAVGTLPRAWMFQECVYGWLGWWNRNVIQFTPMEDYPLTAKGYIKIVKNSYRQILKEFTNIFVQYKNIGYNPFVDATQPYKIMIETNSGTNGAQLSYIERGEWDLASISKLIMMAAIKNDILDETINGGSDIFGTWCSVTFIFNDDDTTYRYLSDRLNPLFSAGQLSSLTAKAELAEIITV